jgi:hypothetical protein
MGCQTAPPAAAESLIANKNLCSVAGNPRGTPHVNIEKVLSRAVRDLLAFFYGAAQLIESYLWKCFLLDVRSDFLKLASLHLRGGVIMNQH